MKKLTFEFVKIHPKAITPQKIKGNLGFDLSVVRSECFFKHTYPGQPNTHRYMLEPGERKLFHTGLKMAIPVGYGVVFWDRSGMSAKSGIQKCAGCIDSSYRGEWLVCLDNTDNRAYEITEGDRIVQAIVIPEYNIAFIENKELDATFRGESGFGASGK